jgi:6-phosphogluconolactonase
MIRTALRRLGICLLLPAFLALGGCGSTPRTVCLAPSSSSPSSQCTCDSSNAACPAPPQYLYGAGVNGEVTVYPLLGGLVGTATSITGPATLGMTALGNQFLYVSDINHSSLDAWSIDPNTGLLTTVPGSPFSLSGLNFGAGMAVNVTAGVIYVAEAGQIEAFKVGSNGALTSVAGSPFPSGTNLYLTVDPETRFLFASDDDPPGSVFAFTLDSAGALHAVAGSPFPTAANSSGNTQPNAIVVEPTGNFVYTALRATGQVAGFSINQTSGVLTPVPTSPFAAGNGPLALTTANDFLYVANAMDGTVSGYSINTNTGVLAPLSGSPFAIPAGALATDFGSFLYASGPAGILAYNVDSNTGVPTLVTGSPFLPSGATVLTVVP